MQTGTAVPDARIKIPVIRVTSFDRSNCYLFIDTEQDNDLSAGSNRAFHHTDDRFFGHYGPPLHRLIILRYQWGPVPRRALSKDCNRLYFPAFNARPSTSKTDSPIMPSSRRTP